MHHNQSFSREFHSQYTFLLHRTVAEPEAAVFVFFLCEAHSSFKGKGKNLKNVAEVIWASSVEGMVLLWPLRSYTPCYFSRLFEVEPTDKGGRLFASWPTLTESLPWAGHCIKWMVFTEPAITALYSLQWLPIVTQDVHFGSMKCPCGGLISSEGTPSCPSRYRARTAGALLLTGLWFQGQATGGRMFHEEGLVLGCSGLRRADRAPTVQRQGPPRCIHA